jgi:hypothetical protein
MDTPVYLRFLEPVVDGRHSGYSDGTGLLRMLGKLHHRTSRSTSDMQDNRNTPGHLIYDDFGHPLPLIDTHQSTLINGPEP